MMRTRKTKTGRPTMTALALSVSATIKAQAPNISATPIPISVYGIWIITPYIAQTHRLG